MFKIFSGTWKLLNGTIIARKLTRTSWIERAPSKLNNDKADGHCLALGLSVRRIPMPLGRLLFVKRLATKYYNDSLSPLIPLIYVRQFFKFEVVFHTLHL